MGVSPQVVTKEDVNRLWSMLSASGAADPYSASRGQISKVFGVGDRRARTLQKHLRRAGGERSGTAQSATEVNEVKGDSWTISLPKTTIHTLPELLEYCKVDATEWEVERFIANKWEVAAKIDEKMVTTPLYQIKAWLKRKVHITDAKAEIAALKEEAKKAAKVYPAIKHPGKQSGYCLELTIPDLHYGLLAWRGETGDANYDCKIAEKTFEDALTALLERTSCYTFDRVLLVLGNDLLHSDNMKGETTAGTPLDVDGRYQKTFVAARKMVTRAIERLRLVAPVTVLIVPGNHDQLSAWQIGDSLDCTFANCPDVTIDNAPTFRKYFQWGQVMLLFAHGNKGRLTDYPLTMATEQSRMFGETKFREAHTGDKHQTKVQEFHGVRVRILPALVARDAWHSHNFFTGNQRCAEAFVWSRTSGLIGTALYTAGTE